MESFTYILLAGPTVSIVVISTVPYLHFVALRRRLDTVTLLEIGSGLFLDEYCSSDLDA
jgi:hypothetical protein